MPGETGVKVEVTFISSFKGLTGTLKWTDLSPYDLPLKNIEIDEQRVYFELEAGPSFMTFDGDRLSRESVKGEYKQRNSPAQANLEGEFFLELKKITETPSDPIEESVELDIETGTIHGTLLTPDILKPPIALLIAGSVGLDRDGNSTFEARRSSNPNTLKWLAIGLSNKGIATVRFDTRGVGESSYDDFDPADLRFESYVNDASGWLNKLEADDRFSKLLVIGHHEGALIAKLAALETTVSGVVALSGAGAPADEIMFEQIENQPALAPEMAADLDLLKSTLASVKAGEELADLPSSYQERFGESARDYLRSWFQYDPRQVAPKLEVPFLVVQGMTDLLVLKGNGQKLAAANPNAQLVEIEQMNHVLKKAGETIVEQMVVLSDPNAPLHEELVPVITQFVSNLDD